MFSSLCATSHLIKPLTSTLDCPIVSLLLSKNLQIYYLEILIYSLRTTNYRSYLAPSHEVTEVAVEKGDGDHKDVFSDVDPDLVNIEERSEARPEPSNYCMHLPAM